jgi:serine/threonine protein kinase
VFYCSPEALLGEETDPRSDLFSLGLVLLELATWRHLYSTASARPGDLEEALPPAVRAQIIDHAAMMTLGADLPDHAEECILRAAAFTPREVEELTQPLAPPLRSIVRGLLQRKPEDRYPSAAALEVDLRKGLAELGAPYGAPEALEEVLESLAGASMSRGVLGPTSEGQLPPGMVTGEDFLS